VFFLPSPLAALGFSAQIILASHFWISTNFSKSRKLLSPTNDNTKHPDLLQPERKESIHTAEMAPATKKAKKTADSINSRLALVMKSGKGARINNSSTLSLLGPGLPV
jgi:hypothetical protein